MQALAIAGVMAYHLGLGWASGGYLGVDLFFVLSGFLITSLLLEENATRGRIAFRPCPARRAVYRGQLRGGAPSTVGLATHVLDFTEFSTPSPFVLTHTWSLAIEEQFYLVWPLVIVGLVTWAKRHWRGLGLGLCAAGAPASALAMALLYHPGVDPSRVYYGTDTRAFDLLVGAALAFVCRGEAPARPRGTPPPERPWLTGC